MRLVKAHLDLAKAEFSEIADEIKQVAILAGIAFALVVAVGFLAVIGTTLFVGEWLFGSIGWGVLHGTLFFLGIALGCVFVALGLGGGVIARNFLLGVIVGIVVGVVLGLDLTNQGWARLGEALNVAINPSLRPLAVGAGALAVVGAVLGLILGFRGGGGPGAFAGLIFGAVVGGALGAFTAITFGPQVGAAIGVAVGLLAWLVANAMSMAGRGVDTEQLKARFWPDETIETTRETIEWVRQRTPLGPKS